MPPFSAAARRSGSSASWQFRDFTGNAASVSVDVSAVATEAEIDALAVSIGSMSNARLMEQRLIDFEVQISDTNPLNTAFDEAYATVKDFLILLFQNSTTGDIRSLRIPAPDAQFFLPDGETVIAPDAGAGAGSGALLLNNTIDDYLTVAGAGWVYARGYLQGTRRRTRQPLPLAEPTGNPGDAPGV